MALFATETWTMRHRLLLTIGAILVVCQLISVFWLWHESKEQIQLLVASAIEGHNNQKHVEHEVREAVASLLVPSLLIVGLALYISMLAVRKITRPLSRLQSELHAGQPHSYRTQRIGARSHGGDHRPESVGFPPQSDPRPRAAVYRRRGA
jgi:two-component system sensor histidine kinase BasS